MQVRLVEALLRQRGLDAAWAAAGREVAVSTVDGYQGREADVVVFSAVRWGGEGRCVYVCVLRGGGLPAQTKPTKPD